MEGTLQMTRGPGRWRWFLAWVVVGALLSFGLIAILSIGILLLVAGTALGAWLGARRPAAHQGLPGLVTGGAVTAAFLAWTSREGPGDVCQSIPGGTECGQQWNPIPFAVVAVLLIATGVVIFVLTTRSRNQDAGS